MASASAIARRYATWTGQPGDRLTASDVFAAYEAGDHAAKKAIDSFYFCLAAGIHNVHYVYNPEKILLGGGISARDDLLDGVRHAYMQLKTSFPTTPFTCHALNVAISKETPISLALCTISCNNRGNSGDKTSLRLCI